MFEDEDFAWRGDFESGEGGYFIRLKHKNVEEFKNKKFWE